MVHWYNRSCDGYYTVKWLRRAKIIFLTISFACILMLIFHICSLCLKQVVLHICFSVIVLLRVCNALCIFLYNSGCFACTTVAHNDRICCHRFYRRYLIIVCRLFSAENKSWISSVVVLKYDLSTNTWALPGLPSVLASFTLDRNQTLQTILPVSYSALDPDNSIWLLLTSQLQSFFATHWILPLLRLPRSSPVSRAHPTTSTPLQASFDIVPVFNLVSLMQLTLHWEIYEF